MILPEVKLQPSDIGGIIPLNTPVVLEFDDRETIRTNSGYIIDRMFNKEYDDYEITRISVENYGWLRIDLKRIED